MGNKSSKSKNQSQNTRRKIFGKKSNMRAVKPKPRVLSSREVLQSMNSDFKSLDELMIENRAQPLLEMNLDKENVLIDVLKSKRTKLRSKARSWREILREKQEKKDELEMFRSEKKELEEELSKMESTIETLKGVCEDMNDMKLQLEKAAKEEKELIANAILHNASQGKSLKLRQRKGIGNDAIKLRYGK